MLSSEEHTNVKAQIVKAGHIERLQLRLQLLHLLGTKYGGQLSGPGDAWVKHAADGEGDQVVQVEQFYLRNKKILFTKKIRINLQVKWYP